MTSSRPEKASPACLLAWNRNHWCIENGLHYVRDFTFDEDRCRIRKHAGARVMASLRNLAISLLRLAGAENIAAALRTCARRPQHPLRWRPRLPLGDFRATLPRRNLACALRPYNRPPSRR